MRVAMQDVRDLFIDAPDILDAATVAKTLGISDNAMRALCKSSIRYLKLGKPIRIPKKWLIEDLYKMQEQERLARSKRADT